MLTLREIEAEVNRLAGRIDVTHDNLPTYGRETSRDLGYAHIEVDGTHYHYVTMERGAEQCRESTAHLEDLLYCIFRDAAHAMAFSYELSHRIEDQDCRRIAFPKLIELMDAISVEFGARASRDIDEILERAPYDDEPTRAVNRMRPGNAT